MYCRHCGNRLEEDAAFCEKCGKPIEGAAERAAIPAGCPGGAAEAGSVWAGGGFQSYEYARTTVESDLSQVAIDCYGSLGYELTGQQVGAVGNQTTFSFRRSRKVRGKAQLAKIQRVMDDALASISRLGSEKTRVATVRASVLGIAAALVLGVGMCCSMVWDGLMAIGVVVGIVGIAGCVGAYFLYRKTYARESARLNPKIEELYDLLATQCEEAQAVLRAG